MRNWFSVNSLKTLIPKNCHVWVKQYEPCLEVLADFEFSLGPYPEVLTIINK